MRFLTNQLGAAKRKRGQMSLCGRRSLCLVFTVILVGCSGLCTGARPQPNLAIRRRPQPTLRAPLYAYPDDALPAPIFSEVSVVREEAEVRSHGRARKILPPSMRRDSPPPSPSPRLRSRRF